MSSPIPERTDEVVLYTNEDQHEIDRLRQVVEQTATKSATPLRLGDDDEVKAAAVAFDDFVRAAAARGTKVQIRAIPGRKWRALVAEHPPREKNAEDAEWGWNVATFADAAVPPCVVSVAGQALEDEAKQDAVDRMTDGDFSRVYSAVVRLNTGRGPDPTVSISEMLRTTSSEISESPER